MGISINIALQLARIAPLVKDCEAAVMLGRQKMHFRRPGWTPRLINGLASLGIEADASDLFQEDGFCETYLNNHRLAENRKPGFFGHRGRRTCP